MNIIYIYIFYKNFFFKGEGCLFQNLSSSSLQVEKIQNISNVFSPMPTSIYYIYKIIIFNKIQIGNFLRVRILKISTNTLR